MYFQTMIFLHNRVWSISSFIRLLWINIWILFFSWLSVWKSEVWTPPRQSKLHNNAAFVLSFKAQARPQNYRLNLTLLELDVFFVCSLISRALMSGAATTYNCYTHSSSCDMTFNIFIQESSVVRSKLSTTWDVTCFKTWNSEIAIISCP